MGKKRNPAMEDQRRRDWLAKYLANGRRGKDAAIDVGTNPVSAAKQANRWLHHPETVAEIARVDALATKKAELSVEGMVREIYMIVHHNVADAFNDDGSLKPLSQWNEGLQRSLAGFEVHEDVEDDTDDEGEMGRTVRRTIIKKVKFHDKLSAIDKGMRHFPGGYAATRLEVQDVTNHGEQLRAAREHRAKMLAEASVIEATIPKDGE